MRRRRRYSGRRQELVTHLLLVLLLMVVVVVVVVVVLLVLVVVLLLLVMLDGGLSSARRQLGTGRREHGRRRYGSDLGHANRRFGQIRQVERAHRRRGRSIGRRWRRSRSRSVG